MFELAEALERRKETCLEKAHREHEQMEAFETELAKYPIPMGFTRSEWMSARQVATCHLLYWQPDGDEEQVLLERLQDERVRRDLLER